MPGVRARGVCAADNQRREKELFERQQAGSGPSPAAHATPQTKDFVDGEIQAQIPNVCCPVA